MKGIYAVTMAVLLGLSLPAWAGNCKEGCEKSPLLLLSSQVQGKRLIVTIQNPTSNTETGYVVGTVQAGGEEINFYVEVTMPPNSVASFSLTFERPINVVSCLTICANIPDGSNEGPDPVGIKAETTSGGTTGN